MEGLIEALWEGRGWGRRAERELAAERAPRAVAGALLSDILGHLPPPEGESEESA
jgi:hypothetical protein